MHYVSTEPPLPKIWALCLGRGEYTAFYRATVTEGGGTGGGEEEAERRRTRKEKGGREEGRKEGRRSRLRYKKQKLTKGVRRIVFSGKLQG